MPANPRDGYDRTKILVQVTIAVAAVVLGIKLGKILWNSGAASLGTDAGNLWLAISKLGWHSTLPRAALLVGLLYLLARRLPLPWRILVALSPLLIFVGAKFIETLVFGGSIADSWAIESGINETRSIGTPLLGVIHLLAALLWRDLAFLSGFTLFAHTLVRLAPPRYFTAVRVALFALLALMFAIAGLELADYIKTGVAGSGRLLAFAVSNAGNRYFWTLVRSEVDLVSTVSLLAPFLIAIAAALFAGRFVPPRSHPARWGRIVPVAALAVVLVTTVYRPALPDTTYARQIDDTYLALLDVLPWTDAPQIEVMRRVAAEPRLFDTSRAALDRAPAAGAPAQPRNLILIMLESARASATTVYDPNLATTPFLADLAKRGAVATDMYAVVPRTEDAWISILHGVYPSSNDLLDRWPSAEGGQRRFHSLPKLLAREGYATGFITADSNASANLPLLRGMDFGWLRTASMLPQEGFEKANYDGFEDKIMVAPALDWIGAQKAAGRPFFLAMMTNVGHHDYHFPSSWPRHSFGTGLTTEYEDYLNCLAYIDSVLHDFFDGLDRLDVLKSSVVVILGDHGESFGEHGVRQHMRVLYDEALKVPMILYGDGVVPPGSSITGLRQEIDLFPTMLEALGFEDENVNAPGISLLQPVPADRKLYFASSFFGSNLALRQGPIKYIYNYGRSPTEAYDLARDPGERHDIAASLPATALKDAEFDMLVWQERVREALIAEPEATRLAQP